MLLLGINKSKLYRIGNIIPFISFPLGLISFSLLITEFIIRSPLIVKNPFSQLILIAGSMTTISLLLLSFRSITQVIAQRNK